MNKGNRTSSLLFTILLSMIFFSTKAQIQIDDTIYFQDLNREYSLYIPKSYTADKLHPLIFDFHGTGGNGADYLANSNLTNVADSGGFLIVSPTATKIMYGNWNWVRQEQTGIGVAVDDPAFISCLIDTLINVYSIDTNRIYCTGQSKGAIFCYALACRLSDRIAAIAPVAGTMFTIDIGACKPTHPMPVFHIHGTNDNTIPITGRDFRFLPIPMVLDFWCNNNRTDRKSILKTFTEVDYCMNDFTETIVCDSDENGASVKFLKIYNGEHSIDMLQKIVNSNLNLTEEIWIFFKDYSLDQWID